MKRPSHLNRGDYSYMKTIRTVFTGFLVAMILSMIACPAKADLFAIQLQPPQLMRFNETSHELISTSYSPDRSESFDGLAFGPDGNIYIVDNILGDGRVLRFHGQTGAFMDVFINPPSSQRIFAPHALTFGPDGQLYIGTSAPDNQGSQIMRYDGLTGAYLNTFITPGSGGLTQLSDLTFGRDGNLYVVDGLRGVLCYSGVNGQFLSVFAAFPTNICARNLAFSPAGDLFLSTTDQGILRFDGTNGNYLGTFISAGANGLTNPAGLAFDAAGNLCVSSTGSRSVLRYQSATGAFIDSFQLPSAPSTSRGPTFLAITPAPPQLKIQRAGLNLVLSWRSGGPAFSLQASTDFSPVCSWTSVTNKPVIVGSENIVTVSILSAARLYRLMR